VPFLSSPEFRHDGTERIGVLLVNSGTPVSLARRDVRRFLRGLLSDPRVVELPRALWLPILYGLILPTAYATVQGRFRAKCQNGYSNVLHHQDPEAALLRSRLYINQCRRRSHRAHGDV